MKKANFKLASMIMMMAALIFSACSESGITNPVNNENDFNFEMPVIDIQKADIKDATIENEMSIVNSAVTNGNYNFNQIIETLGLTDTQKEQIRLYLNEHKEFIVTKTSDLANEENARIIDANIERQNILNELKNEMIDDETATVKITALNAEVRNDMDETGIYADFERDVYHSRFEFNGKVKDMLNEEQTEVWNRYIARNNSIFLGPIY